jgi:hypothetical protein
MMSPERSLILSCSQEEDPFLLIVGGGGLGPGLASLGPSSGDQGYLRVAPVVLTAHKAHGGGHLLAWLEVCPPAVQHFTNTFDPQDPRVGHGFAGMALDGHEFGPVEAEGFDGDEDFPGGGLWVWPGR